MNIKKYIKELEGNEISNNLEDYTANNDKHYNILDYTPSKST
jgi:hypothetical protein